MGLQQIYHLDAQYLSGSGLSRRNMHSSSLPASSSMSTCPGSRRGETPCIPISLEADAMSPALAFQHIDLRPFVQGLWPVVFFTAALRSEIPPLSAKVACQRTLSHKSGEADIDIPEVRDLLGFHIQSHLRKGMANCSSLSLTQVN